jgi:menaquinone reductase, multiheme cytochrome c subunit
MDDFHFPPWMDRARPLVAVLLLAAPLYGIGVLYYGGAPRPTDVGYAPQQPVAYSHALHAGELGIDCRYCHTVSDAAPYLALPPTATCQNCHQQIAPQAQSLLPVAESAASGRPIRWVRVHDLPDYVYFDHSAHVMRGVGCVSCHQRVDRMPVVYQAETLSMSWCLDCHRHPEPHLRPVEAVTDMTWTPAEDQAQLGRRLRQQYNINPPTDCSACHR